ncbi:MAG: isoprenylcysteine carboxylmethyltransferase family protein [Thermoflexales bacterium]|nr:isoprenylcysteine carboxylmethyltransferase family protein [Thermoflexales bacterium]
MKIARGIGSVLYTLAIYVGLPLIGWGLDDVTGFFSQPQLLVYSVSIALFGAVVGYQVSRSKEALRGGKGQEDKFVSRQRVVRVVVTGLLLGALVFVPFADRRAFGIIANSPLARWVGLTLATLGMGVIIWSGLALGKLYSPDVTIQKEHHLITDGPYRCIRHPRYLGGMIQGIGLSLLFRSWIGLVLTGLFVAIILFRIKDEEALMGKEFGQEWETYCRKSWRLMPFMW